VPSQGLSPISSTGESAGESSKKCHWGCTYRLHFKRTPNSDSLLTVGASMRFFYAQIWGCKHRLQLHVDTVTARLFSVIHQPCPSVLTPNGFVKHDEAPKTWMSKHEDLFINQLDGNLRHLPRVERYRPKALQLWFQVRGKQRQRLLCPAGAGVESNLGVHGPSWAHLGWSWMATFVATQFAWHQNQQLWHHPNQQPLKNRQFP